jgi:hypothetical protein
MHRPLDHARDRRDPTAAGWGRWRTGARARAAVAGVVLAGLSATLVLTLDGALTAAGAAPENAQVAPSQVAAGGPGRTTPGATSSGAGADVVAPVPLTVPDVLEPGTTTTVPVPDVPEGATGVLLDLTVTQLLPAGDPCVLPRRGVGVPAVRSRLRGRGRAQRPGPRPGDPVRRT